MGTKNQSLVVRAIRFMGAVLWGLLKLIGTVLVLTTSGAGSGDGSQRQSRDGSVRIEVFNPNSRRWSFAGSCGGGDTAVEAAMQRAMRQFGFATKARAVDASSGAVVNFTER